MTVGFGSQGLGIGYLIIYLQDACYTTAPLDCVLMEAFPVASHVNGLVVERGEHYVDIAGYGLARVINFSPCSSVPTVTAPT